MLIQSISKECCIVGKRRNLLQRLKLSNFWIGMHPKKRTRKLDKGQKKGSKYNSVAIVTDSFNWSFIALKIVYSISISDFRSANQVTPCRKSRHSLWLLEFPQTPLKRKTNYKFKWISYFFWERNWDHQWQSFPPIEWTSKEIYIIKLVFIERKKRERGWSWLNFRIWISHKERRGPV